MKDNDKSSPNFKELYSFATLREVIAERDSLKERLAALELKVEKLLRD